MGLQQRSGSKPRPLAWTKGSDRGAMNRLHMITLVIFGSLCLLQLMSLIQNLGKPHSENHFMAGDKADDSGDPQTGNELAGHEERILRLTDCHETIEMSLNDPSRPGDMDGGHLDAEEGASDALNQRPSASDPPPLRVYGNLLVTSIGRSGSSFFGELLASQGSNMYFYEPIRALGRKSNLSEETVRDELSRTFRCEVREAVLRIGKSPSVNIKHKYVYGKTRAEVRLPKVIEFCKKEPLRIIKTIRTRLKWTKRLLDEKDLNLKVIHLVRDPRGSSTSMDNLKWKQNSSFICNNILKDLQEREEMEALYPDRYFFIKYEDLCRDPYGQMRLIFRFLRGEAKGHDKYTVHLNQSFIPSSHKATYGMTTHSRLRKTDGSVISRSNKAANRFDMGLLHSDLPEGVLSYLQSHIHVNFFSKKNPWTTVRDTSSVYQNWRKKITQKDLIRVETDCRQVIKILNYKFFGTVKSARNLTIPLISEPNVLSL